jgi:DMSO/TMAO reductase YedYZ molybdopterin-dependent catalytic subunit
MPDATPSLVEKRRRYIDRQRALRADRPEAFARAAPAGTGEPNRHGMPKLPVGQHVVKNWPVRDLGDLPEVSHAEWRLEIGGLCENPLSLSWDDFMQLPQTDDVSDFHCVTTWSKYDCHWSGVAFTTLYELVQPKPEAKFVYFTSFDGYSTNLPLDQCLDDDVLIATGFEGKPVPREHGGPARVIVPKIYAWKGAKFVKGIEFLAEDRLGYWEVRGYSNTADPWKEERYA